MSKATMTEPREGFSMPGGHPLRQGGLRPWLMLMPSLLLTIGFVIPLLVVISYSFEYRVPNDTGQSMAGLRNYVETFSDPRFWHAFGVTVRYGLSATAAEMVLGTCLALLLNQAGVLSHFLRRVLIIPLAIAPVIGALIWLLFMSPTVGMLRIPLGWIGLGDFRWGADPDWALFSLIIIDVWIYTPFVVILVLAGLRSLPKSAYEAALIDGGSAWFIHKSLTLPMLVPVLLIALGFRLATSLQEFGIIFAATKGGPENRTLSLAVASYNEAFLHDNPNRAVPMLLFLWFATYVICLILIGFWRKAQKAASGGA